MRVCLLNDSFAPAIDGVVNVVTNYANHLMNDHGAEVMVGTPRYPGADYSVYPYPVVPYQSFDTSAIASGYRAGNPFEPKALDELSRFWPDIIHTHCPATATMMARVLREQTGAPVIFTYHTKFDVDINRVVKLKPIADEGIRVMIESIEACDDIWVVSKGAGENLKMLGFKGDYTVMPNGVDFEKGRVAPEAVAEATKGADLPEGVPVFLFVGRMMTYKGLPLILDALRMLEEAGQDFRMVFIGKGPDQKLMEEKAEALGIRERCIFTGPIYDRDVLRAWNTRADLFLFPSTFDTNGLVVREAAACGLASVLIKDSCAAEGIVDDHNGFLIEESAGSMAALLKKVSGDLPHLHEVGAHAMDEIYMSWRDCVSMAYDRYRYVLEQKKEGMLIRKKLPADYLYEQAAKRIAEQNKLRRLGEELLGNFTETAAGMLENMQESGEKIDQLFQKAADQIMPDDFFR